MSETLFRQVSYSVGDIIGFIDLGQIGLPDIQRPFVWKNTKVRDLFDSMYRGYPVGYLLLWQNAYTGEGARTIGVGAKQRFPDLLIVDGQQRLTSLYAVIKGRPVVRENYDEEPITIAFNPLREKFEVADAAVRRDKAFIPNISELWDPSNDIFELVDGYIDELPENLELSQEERQRAKKAINRLYSLKAFPLTALELASSIDEEQVAEVFVRINSQGITLNQADFILTLMSVFWDEGRTQLEQFCREARQPTAGDASPFNHYITPDPDQLLRVSVGLAFKRARLQYVYSILRGKDLETEEFSEERRKEQFAALEEAQSRTLNLLYWHDYFKVLLGAGFRGGRFISSDNNLLYTYILYLIGRTEFDIPEPTLRNAISRWFFMANLTGRYTGSPESAMESDLARFRDVTDPDRFIQIINTVADSNLTNDFWEITLPEKLATSAAFGPSLFAYYAALVLLDAKALFSSHKVTDLLEPSVHSTRAATERHHLYPKGYLEKLGVTSTRNTNQIANFAICEWSDNAEIGDKPPSEYLPELRERVGARELVEHNYWHALPDGWEEMEYEYFLQARRELLAKVIRDGYEKLRAQSSTARDEDELLPIEDLVVEGETDNLELKATLRVNLHTNDKDPRMELAALKTIAGFLNNGGGTLIIGVGDDGQPVGIGVDGFDTEDRMHLHLVNLVRDRMSPHHMIYVHPRFQDYKDRRVLAVECMPAKSPAWVKDGNAEKFFVRTGAATTELTPSQAQQFIEKHF